MFITHIFEKVQPYINNQSVGRVEPRNRFMSSHICRCWNKIQNYQCWQIWIILVCYMYISRSNLSPVALEPRRRKSKSKRESISNGIYNYLGQYISSLFRILIFQFFTILTNAGNVFDFHVRQVWQLSLWKPLWT